ncbi:MAG: undecaprenyl-phosphate glucose phosphotransferase, partial [Sphaerochaeta sp.]|nr:undecaprenyl-phosphate glucose phosphotransferase [Sphaerochaeta sp.]
MKSSKRSLLALKLLCDTLAILLSWLLAGYLRFYVIPGGVRASFTLFLQISVLVVAYTLFFISRNGLYVEDLEHSWRKETNKLIFSAFEGFLLLVITLYFGFSAKVSRLAIGLHFILII